MKSSKIIKLTVLTVLTISILAVGTYGYMTGKNKRVIYSHRNEYHNIIKYLFEKQIVENQIAEEFIKRFPPTKIASHDNYLTIQYFKNNEEPVDDCCVFYSYYVHIIAKDNKLVKAYATEGFVSTIDYVFFSILSDSAEDDYWDSRMNNAVSSGSS